MNFDAVLVAGGGARRLGGVAKPALVVGGRRLVDRVAAAVAGAGRIVVVGPDLGVPGAVMAREDPPGGGPVAALAAGLPHVTAPLVAVLAADLPFLTGPVVRALVDEVAGDPAADVAVLVDADGRDQALVAVWRTDRLRARVATVGEPAGSPVRRLLSTACVRRAAPSQPPGVPPPWYDCDTEQDLARAREWA